MAGKIHAAAVSILIVLAASYRAHALGRLHMSRRAVAGSTPAFAPEGDVGEPLFVTPLLKNGQAEQARELSSVDLGDASKNITSHSGFITTSDSPRRDMFFWFFRARNPSPDAPLVIWLQGGPGGSSNFGLFSENGPWELDANLNPVEREYAWSDNYNMLFIDNPVGAGFSFPSSDEGYCEDTKVCVASNLFSLIQQFYELFPDQASTPLFITGESYGGHYVPGFAHYIFEHNTKASKCQRMPICNVAEVPLKGIAVGDGWIDPINMIPAYTDLFSTFGLADNREVARIEEYVKMSVEYIKNGKMKESFDVWDEFLNGDVWPYKSFFYNITNSLDYDNVLRTTAPAEFGRFVPFLNQPYVRKAIHVGNATFNSGHECEMHLLSDFMVSFASELVDLLESSLYDIFIYSGQLDIIIGSKLTTSFLEVLPWKGLDDYLQAEKQVWRMEELDDPVAGFVKKARTLTHIILRNAGHIAPYDAPAASRRMIDNLILSGGRKDGWAARH